MKALITIIALVTLQISCNESSFKENKDSKGSTFVDRSLEVSEIQSVIFEYGSPSQEIDYLFVIDNSVSMNAILTLVQQGFASALGDGVFPENSLVAVMSTMIADPNNLSLPSPLLNTYQGINLEPGFLDLVDQQAIKNYRDLVPTQATKWPLDGCQQKWFKPDEVNAAGTPCLTAATQSTFFAVLAEAGIIAYEQFMLKRGNEATFRNNSLVNVIFVSDTHDPGFNNPALVATRKNYQQLDELTRVANKIKGLKFHALAPQDVCPNAGEALWDRSYYTLVDAAKGQKADSCSTNDYTDFIKKMVESSKVAEPNFDLGTEFKEIVKVIVDGKEIENYQLLEDGHTLRIEGLDPYVPVKVEVSFI